MTRLLLSIVAAWSLGANAGRAAELPDAWPQFTGASGGFTIAGPDQPLVEKIADMRLLWVSDFHGLGVTKFGARSRGSIIKLPAEAQFIGGWSSPIAAQGLVFCAFYKPGGKPAPADVVRPAGPSGDSMTPAMQYLRADDGLVAIDAKTGKTCWVTMNEQEGINFVPDKRQGWAVSPVWIDGVVVSLGTRGILSGYDAATGKRKWKFELPNCHDRLSALIVQHEADKRYVGRINKQANLIAAGGLAIVPDQHGGLAAVEPASGKLRWHLKPDHARGAKGSGATDLVGSYSTPASWTYGGKAYVVCQNNAGTLRLIDVEKGSVVWTLDGLGPNYATVQVLSGGVVPVNARPSKSTDNDYGLYGGVVLGVEKPKVAWTLPDEPKYRHVWILDRGAEQRFLDLGTTAALWLRPHEKTAPMRRLTIDPRTGKILSDEPLTESKVYPMMEQGYPLRIGDRVLAVRDPAHSPKECGLELFRVEDGRLRSLDNDPLWPRDRHIHAGGYEVSWLRTALDGRLYVRTYDGAIACYDLRRR
jgi:outer membrane protein assembly factor BamB